MTKPRVAVLHYSAPPTVGGVEAVIAAHANLMVASGYPVAVIAGRGEARALPDGAELIAIPELDSRHPEVSRQSAMLEKGELPADFSELADRIAQSVAPILARFDTVIVHNIFTKHFNLPLTAALAHLLERGELKSCITWIHDSTWTSPNSRSKVHPGYPWDLLRAYRPELTYVTVSQERQRDLADLYGCPRERIRVIYNGVDPERLLGLSLQGAALARRLDLFESDLVLLMPVRVTQAKNIEYALHFLLAIKRRGVNARIVLTGPPDPHDPESLEYFDRLRVLRRELGLEREMRFVYESGPEAGRPYLIDPGLVGELYRMSDALFMPSHREGFGMPVLEAGLAGIPVIARAVPAAVEIAGDDLIHIQAEEDPAQLAGRVLDWSESSRVIRLRRRLKKNYTWEAIFHQKIEPLLSKGDPPVGMPG
jgi:glycosyltransferase involved in cell wall biosynthesis